MFVCAAFYSNENRNVNYFLTIFIDINSKGISHLLHHFGNLFRDFIRDIVVIFFKTEKFIK